MEKTYLTAGQMRVRYGNRSEMFLTRIMQSDPAFPRPVMLGRLRLWAIDEVEEYERALAARREPEPPRRAAQPQPTGTPRRRRDRRQQQAEASDPSCTYKRRTPAPVVRRAGRACCNLTR
jgi:hypothetical protein